MRIGFILKRSLLLILVVWLAGTLNFITPRLGSGDPILERLARETAGGGYQSEGIKEMVEAWNVKFGLDQPLWKQYLNYMKDMLTLDFGYSINLFPAKVGDIVEEALPWTFGLLFVAIILSFLFGIIIGGLMGWTGSPRWLKFLMPPSVMFSAIPYYLLGMFLVWLLGFKINIFPLFGGHSADAFPSWNWNYVVDIVRHATLPALSIVLSQTGFWAVSMRGMMVTTQGEDYMLFAEARGLSGLRRFFNYGIRNAMLPQVTGLALALAHVIGGAVLVEVVFNYPGIGKVLYLAIRSSDYFLLYGVVYIVILSIGIATFIVDILYPILDPRIRYQAG